MFLQKLKSSFSRRPSWYEQWDVHSLKLEGHLVKVYSVTKMWNQLGNQAMCKHVSCFTYDDQTNWGHIKFTVIWVVVLAFCCLPSPWWCIVKAKWRKINKMYEVNRLLSLTELKICLDKLGKINVIEFSWILINCGFYRNQHDASLALYLKMLVLVTSISVPNFMLVSKRTQFTWNFELCHRTILNTNLKLLWLWFGYLQMKGGRFFF